MRGIFIIEKSFLIRSALVRMISEVEDRSYIHELNSLAELNYFDSETENAIIIIDEKQLPENYEKEFNRLELKNYRLIQICSKNESKFKEADTICLDEEQDSIMRKIRSLPTSRKDKNREENGKAKILSDRETNILRYVALGYTNKEIADKLFLSSHTVIAHRKNISAKLGIKTIAGFTVYALLNNIILPNEIGTT